ISSHILHELAELCNVVGIIERGKLLYSGPVKDILRRAKVGHVLHVGVTDRFADAAEVMSRFPGVSKISTVDGGITVNGKPAPLFHVAFDDGKGHTFTDLPNVLINQGFRIAQFSEEPVNLETAFMRLTKGLV